MQHLELPPPPMREPGSPISVDMERVVMRALEKHWQMRYASVSDFARALQEAYAPRPPFIRAAPADMPFEPSEDDSPRDDLPVVTSHLPAEIPEPDSAEPPVQEMLASKQYTPVRRPIPDGPSGERQTDPATPAPGQLRLPAKKHVGTPRQYWRKALLVLMALGLIGALSLGGLLLTWGANQSALGNSPGNARSPSQKTQPQTSATAGSTPLPTRQATPAPGVSATSGTTPGATPDTTPTATPSDSASPTPTTQAPILSVSPGSLKFVLHIVNCLVKNQPKKITLHNMGGGTLNWQASLPSPTSLTIDTTSGSITAEQAAYINVAVDCSKLTISENDTLTITWNGGSTNVSITINVS